MHCWLKVLIQIFTVKEVENIKLIKVKLGKKSITDLTVATKKTSKLRCDIFQNGVQIGAQHILYALKRL